MRGRWRRGSGAVSRLRLPPRPGYQARAVQQLSGYPGRWQLCHSPACKHAAATPAMQQQTPARVARSRQVAGAAQAVMTFKRQ